MISFTAVRERWQRAERALGIEPPVPPTLEWRAMQARLRVADALSDARDLPAAAVLYQDALRIAGDAASETTEGGPATAWDALAPAELVAATGRLREQAHARARALRSPGYLANPRARRSLLLAVMLLVLAALVLYVQPFAARNLALGKNVTASPGAIDLPALVDGQRGTYDTIGAYTPPGAPNPFVQVDLGQMTRIRRIVICNRGDRNMDDGLPYILELSNDGAAFQQVATRATHFGDGSFGSPPWTVRMDTRARYVRVRAHGYVALSELEVY